MIVISTGNGLIYEKLCDMKLWPKTDKGATVDMWTVIYVTGSENMAHRIEERMTQEGFLVKVRPSVAKQFELLVPASEVREAQEVLNSFLQA